MQVNDICKNYKSIRSELPDGVQLVAVSKTRSVDEIRLAMQAGCLDFGENKAQELCEKYEQLPDVRWHFIGRLQKNKVRKIVGKVCLIHSVDSLELAEEIDKRAAAISIVQDILVQVNVAGEKQKGGVSLEDASSLLKRIKENCRNIRVVGLMQTAPKADDPENDRIFFKQLHDLFEKEELQILSMGMSADYKVAIEEGANCVRLGGAIFGERDYKL